MQKQWYKFVREHKYSFLAVSVSFIFWFCIHIPLLQYGTEPIPIHAAYVGDEQGPINGALHVLQSRNILALRDAYNTQYGPLISLVAIPAVVVDFVWQGVKTGEFGAESYKNAILWDWTGMLYNARILALGTSILGLWAVYRITFITMVDAPRRKVVSAGAVLLLGLNFHFFEYATYFRHWIFIIVILLLQVYFLQCIRLEEGRRIWPWVASALLAVCSFGISYFGIFFQILWAPSAIQWLMQRKFVLIQKLVFYTTAVAVGCALIVAWVPGPFYRAIGIGYGDIAGTGVNEHIAEEYGNTLSFGYYTEVVGANNIALVLALCIMLYLLIRYRVQHDWVWSGSIALAAVSYFIFFAVQSHHEPRYILPTTVLLILLSGIFFALLNKRKWPGGIFFRNVVLGLLCFQLLFHAVHIGRMLYLYLDGPAEQQMLERLLSILTDTEGAVSVLALRDNLLAHPHTHESYDAYAKLYGFADRGLFTTLQTTAIYPRDTYLLDVTYFSYFHLPPEQAPHMGNYEIIISRHRPNEPDVPNNRDPGGVNIMRYWYPDILQEQYVLYFHSARLQQQYGTYEDTF